MSELAHKDWIDRAAAIRFRDKAFDAYFTNPRYLQSIREKFGPETEAHIREMTAHKLTRNNA